MAGYQLNRSTAGSTDFTDWISAVEQIWKGNIGISLTNWDTTGTPAIAEGSWAEVGGSIFYFGDTEAISGTPSTANLNYIMITTSSSNATVSYTTTAPTWCEDKNGWYDATEAKRYVGGCDIDLGDKWIYNNRSNVKDYDTGWINRSDWTNVHLGSSTTKNADSNVTHNLRTNLSDLLIKVLLSTDGTDNNSWEARGSIDSDTAGKRGINIDQVDMNNILIQTGANGIAFINTVGNMISIDTENYYYKVKVYKLIDRI